MKYIVKCVCFVLFWSLSSAISIGGFESESQLWWGLRTPQPPQFMDTPLNVTSNAGESAFLPCSVQHLGDRSVTWMRKRGLQILTAGVFTYSADSRYRILHTENSNDWTLQIQYSKPEDSGVYECQVNADPKISRQLFLHVKENRMLDDPEILTEYVHKGVIENMNNDYPTDETYDPKHRSKTKHNKRTKKKIEPSVLILGAQERHIETGSLLTLTCVVRHQRRAYPEIDWFHDNKMISPHSPRGGISFQTKERSRETISKLNIVSVTSADSGEYTCSPSSMVPFTVVVHAQNGDQQQAVQQMNTSKSPSNDPARILLLIIVSLTMHVLGLLW